MKIKSLSSMAVGTFVIVLFFVFFAIGTSFARSGTVTTRNKYTGKTTHGTYKTSTVQNKYTGKKYTKVNSTYSGKNKYTGKKQTFKTTAYKKR